MIYIYNLYIITELQLISFHQFFIFSFFFRKINIEDSITLEIYINKLPTPSR